MQISARESIMSASIPLMYVENSQVTKVGGSSLRYSKGKSNKLAQQLVIPSSVYYMCTGDKFVPISTDKPVFQVPPKSNQVITKNFNQKSRTSSNTLALPGLSIPVNDVHNQNDKGKYLIVSNSDTSENNYSDKKNTIRNQEISRSRESVQSLHTRRIFFTGTIERILRWNRNLQDIFCLYETIAPVISLQEGRIIHQKIMLLRDRKGPILQVQFFSSTHIDINDFYIGQYLRCVGRMTGMNILSAESIREAKEEEILNLSRLTYVCDYSVNQNIIKE
ncbi:hypothetical protein WA026_001686 [Henosepilachna vigintioctopunctata]|uniref:Uncharacterized protein n=1 Tax=Henosepilachna vigintioctopunctata TaxID=420089 RepID=A0AAW1ULW8_9CUCU